MSQDNEILTFGSILSRIHSLAQEHNFIQLEWPSYDKIFEITTWNDSKTIANNVLKTLQVLITREPIQVIDTNEKLELFKRYHNDEINRGHSGHKKVYARLRHSFYWRNMSRVVSKYIKNCNECKLSKPSAKTTTTKTMQTFRHCSGRWCWTNAKDKKWKYIRSKDAVIM